MHCSPNAILLLLRINSSFPRLTDLAIRRANVACRQDIPQVHTAAQRITSAWIYARWSTIELWSTWSRKHVRSVIAYSMPKQGPKNHFRLSKRLLSLICDHSNRIYLLGTPDTSFKGRKTRTARSVRRSMVSCASFGANNVINLYIYWTQIVIYLCTEYNPEDDLRLAFSVPHARAHTQLYIYTINELSY